MVNGAHFGYSGHTMEVSTMRLFKKAAVCLLAAAMAVSMLTACGDDGPSNPGNGGNGGSTGGGNTSTSTPAKPDEGNSGNNNNTDNKDNENSLPKTWADSKTKVFYEKCGATDTNIYVSGTLLAAQISSKQTQQYDILYAVQGKKAYLKLTGTNPSTNKKETVEFYKDTDDNYFTKPNDAWIEITNEDQKNTLTAQLQVLQNIYKVPTAANVVRCVGMKSDTNATNYIESLTVKLSTGNAGYGYEYSSDGKLLDVAAMDGKFLYATTPITITACPNSFAFPNT